MFTAIALAFFMVPSYAENYGEIVEMPLTAFRKCCTLLQPVNGSLECTAFDTGDDIPYDRIDHTFTCTVSDESRGEDHIRIGNHTDNIQLCNDTCISVSPNGTIIIYQIDRINESLDRVFDVNGSIDRNSTNETEQSCESLFTPLKFWGATIVVFANLIYIVPYFIVVLFYIAIPDLRNRAYDGAVIAYNVSQIISNLILILLGYSLLCQHRLNPIFYAPAGLSLMFLTISSTLWLFVICFDMTLVITRFRWVPPGDANRQSERRKFWIYASWVWGITAVPTLFALIVEFAPMVPKNFILRPKFETFHDGPNIAVIVYVAGLPFFICLTNSVLFFYTTYKMIVMRKSTAMATRSSTKNAKKKYYVYLRLYLLMDSPWVTGALGAIFTDLWILKFCRMVQPVLMLLAILPRRTFTRVLTCAKEERKERNETSDETKKRLMICC